MATKRRSRADRDWKLAARWSDLWLTTAPLRDPKHRATVGRIFTRSGPFMIGDRSGGWNRIVPTTIGAAEFEVRSELGAAERPELLSRSLARAIRDRKRKNHEGPVAFSPHGIAVTGGTCKRELLPLSRKRERKLVGMVPERASDKGQPIELFPPREFWGIDWRNPEPWSGDDQLAEIRARRIRPVRLWAGWPTCGKCHQSLDGAAQIDGTTWYVCRRCVGRGFWAAGHRYDGVAAIGPTTDGPRHAWTDTALAVSLRSKLSTKRCSWATARPPSGRYYPDYRSAYAVGAEAAVRPPLSCVDLGGPHIAQPGDQQRPRRMRRAIMAADRWQRASDTIERWHRGARVAVCISGHESRAVRLMRKACRTLRLMRAA